MRFTHARAAKNTVGRQRDFEGRALDGGLDLRFHPALRVVGKPRHPRPRAAQVFRDGTLRMRAEELVARAAKCVALRAAIVRRLAQPRVQRGDRAAPVREREGIAGTAHFSFATPCGT